MKLTTLLFIGSATAFTGACAKDASTANTGPEITAAEETPVADSERENEELQEKLSRLSASLKELADTMGKNAEKTSASMKKDLAGIQAELDKVGTMIRKGSEETHTQGKKVFGKAVDEMDHLVKRMKETLDEE